MILPRNVVPYKIESPRLLSPYVGRRLIVKEPPKSIRFPKTDNSINYIRNTIFISKNSYKMTEKKPLDYRKKTRPLSVEKIQKSFLEVKNIRLSSQIGSRPRNRKDSLQENFRLDSEEDTWEYYKAACISMHGINRQTLCNQ